MVLMANSTFGERFAFARWWRMGMVHRDLTDGDLARALRLTGGTVSQWRERETAPPQGKVEQLAKLCGVDFYWLFHGERGGQVPAPDLFPQFVAVYRDYVARGGLKRGKSRRPAGRRKQEVPVKQAVGIVIAGHGVRRRTG